MSQPTALPPKHRRRRCRGSAISPARGRAQRQGGDPDIEDGNRGAGTAWSSRSWLVAPRRSASCLGERREGGLHDSGIELVLHAQTERVEHEPDGLGVGPEGAPQHIGEEPLGRAQPELQLPPDAFGASKVGERERTQVQRPLFCLCTHARTKSAWCLASVSLPDASIALNRAYRLQPVHEPSP